MLLDLVAINGLFFLFGLLGLNSEFLVSQITLLIITTALVSLGRVLGIYDSLTRFFNFFELKRYILLLFIFSALLVLIDSSVSFERWFFIFFSFITATIPYRFLIKQLNSNALQSAAKSALLYGAGEQGVYLKRSFFNSPHFSIVGFVDDDKALRGRKIDGVYVFSLGKKLDHFIKKNNVGHVIFGTAKFSTNRKQFLIDHFKSRQIQTYNLPSSDVWINKKPSAAQLKKIRIEDILARPEIDIDQKSNSDSYMGKKILITGGAGSIGSELLKQLIKFKPLKIIVIDINETALFYLGEEIKSTPNVELLVLNVLDFSGLKQLYEREQFDYVFHAAAYKHVSVVEDNAVQGLKNNIIGTFNVAQLALQTSVKRFVLVSTDKAVRPTNVMGASKRYCELLINMLSRDEKVHTKFITTRFGNVLGSNGSVIPIFRSQIEQGGPIKLTHPEITRYFMTIPEASKLVVESGRIGENNQVFVFDMGEQVKIIDMAKNMISLSGFRPYEDIDIEIVGLRPGEKLYEELLLDTETMVKSVHSHLFIAQKETITPEQCVLIEQLIAKLEDTSKCEAFEVIQLLKQIIPEYKSNNSPFEALDHA
jgi:FlaA1/EpsC-like NDP-sugar epimerase